MRRGIGALGAIALAAMAAAVPVQGQVAGARELVAGEVATGAPARVASPDIYYFVGEAGAKLTFALSSKAATRLVLYTPTGEEMLTAGGDTGVSLEAVLPYSEVYTLAVIRREAAQPYTLFMTATQPTLGETMIAGGSGYEGPTASGNRQRLCWIEPGVAIRVTFSDTLPDIQYVEATLGSDRETISVTYKSRNGNISSYVRRHRIEDTEHVETLEYPDGRKTERREAFTPDFFTPAQSDLPALRFTGYHCDPAASRNALGAAAGETNAAERPAAQHAAADAARRQAEARAFEADRQEVAGTAQANQEMAAFSARQVAENVASARQATEAQVAYAAAVAERERIVRQNEAAAAERERTIRESEARYRAEMAEWERKVAACKAGERASCAQD